MASESILWYNERNVEYPPLTREFTGDVIDVVIIGAGFTGLSCAYHILKESPGTSVYVLEAEHVGYGASGRTSGILAERSVVSFADQIASQGLQKTLEDLNLKRKAIEYVKQVAKEVNAEVQEGRNYLYAGERLLVEKEYEAMKQLGIQPLQFYDAKELQEKKLCSTFYEAAVLGPASWVHPYQLVSGLAKAVHSKGGYIFEKSKVTKVKQTNPTIIKVNGCELVTSTVVLATNAYTPQLGFFKNRLLPVQTGVLVTKKLTPDQLNSLGWKDREVIQEATTSAGCTLQLTSDDRLFIRGTAHYQYNDALGPLDMKDIESKLLMQITKRFPQLASVAIAHRWSGVVAFTLDFHPCIGKLPTDDYEVLYSMGYNAYGVATGVYYGKLLQELYFDDDSADLKTAMKHTEPPWAGSALMRYLLFGWYLNPKKYLPKSWPLVLYYGFVFLVVMALLIRVSLK